MKNNPIIIHAIIILSLINVAVTSHQESICNRIRNAHKKYQQDELKSLIEQIQQKRHDCVINLVPKYYWAQNMTHLFVKVTFLNSVDTSACSQAIFQDKDVHHQGFSVKLICLQSNLIINYELKIKTYMPLNFYHHQWRDLDQNGVVLQVMKSPSPFFWKKLLLDNFIVGRPPKIWWKIIKAYEIQLQKYLGDLQIGDQETDISQEVRKQNKKSDTTQDIQYDCNRNNPFYLGSWI